MSKTLKILIILLLSVAILPFETSKANNVARCGFQMGGGMARFGGNPYNDESEFRLRFGIFASARFIGSVHYQVELNYVQKGGFGESVYVNYLSDSVRFEVEAQLDYIEVPLLIKIVPHPESSLGPIMTGGTYLAWILEKHYSGDQYQPAHSDFGVLLGFGFHPTIAGRAFILEARYTRGLKKIIDDPLGHRLSNRTLSLTLGVEL